MPKRDREVRAMLETSFSEMEIERSSFTSHWQDLSRYIQPRRGRFLLSDRNRGDKRRSNIIDSTATFASRTLTSMMMGGITAPSRPWFKLSTSSFRPSEDPDVQQYLHIVGTLMSTVFLKSNLYNVLPILYTDLHTFGTACAFMEEDLDNVFRMYAIPIGSYMIAVDGMGRVNRFAREMEKTVDQVVTQFSERDEDGMITNWGDFSEWIRARYEGGHRQEAVVLKHHVYENDDFVQGSDNPKERRYSSVYYEAGAGSTRSSDQQYTPTLGILRHRGYDFNPVLAPRWEVTGEDAYGTNCPAMTALGDIKQLQLGERRIAQAIEKMINPPLVGPTSLRNTKTSLLPGDVTHLDERDGQRGLRPLHEVQARIGEMENKNEQVRQRIRRAFFEDIALQMILSDRREMTATEVEERSKEKLLAMGPVLEQLNQDLLDPLIDNTFTLMSRQGLLPDPPEQLQGVKVEYISIMAQAQKAVGTANIDRVLGRIEQSSQFQPDLWDKVDLDQMVDVYSDMHSLPPGIIRSDDDVEIIRQQRAQAQAQQQQMAMMQQAAATAKDLSRSDTGGDNALTALLSDGAN